MADELERTIEDLPPADAATDDHFLAGSLEGTSEKVSIPQVSTKVQADMADTLAMLAPLNSPSFTGNPTVPTPSPDDDDLSIPNTGWVQDEIAAAIAINPLTAKTTPVDADELAIADSAASFGPKKLSFANLWAWISGKVLALFGASGAAPVFACRAWVNFNGTGTVAIRSSGNVSSVTDLGMGSYRVNFTTAVPDANYAVVLGANYATSTDAMDQIVSGGRLAASVQVQHFESGALADTSDFSVAVFR